MTEELEPITPERAIELYEHERTDELSPRTLQTHRARLGHFLRWTEDTGISDLRDLTGRELYEYRVWRKDDADGIETITIRGELSTLWQLLLFCERINAVEPDLHDKVHLPAMEYAEGIRDDTIAPDRMREVLDHLAQFEYASRKHTVLLLFWKLACRIGALRSLDVSHFDREEQAIEFEHRPEIDLPLKNSRESERFVALDDETTEAVADWIDFNRPDVSDEHGNEPLIATAGSRSNGRITISGFRDIGYANTRPWVLGECICDEQYGYNAASKCEGSVNPHALRRSALSFWLHSEDQGGAEVPKQIVSDPASPWTTTRYPRYRNSTHSITPRASVGKGADVGCR